MLGNVQNDDTLIGVFIDSLYNLAVNIYVYINVLVRELQNYRVR